MPRTFLKNKVGASAGGQYILYEVWLVHAFPNTRCYLNGLLIIKLGISLEIRLGIRKSGRTQGQKTVDVPTLNILGARIHVNGKIKEIAEGQIGGFRALRVRRSQDIQTLEDKDIRGGYLNALVGDDVVVQMRILRCRDTLSARLDPRNELQQGSTIVGLPCGA